ncbi:MAG TPA: glycosyltransferase family 4 protein [Tepidisphaeraceae bacterium]|jgi:glycosyltransferase involved in cell wall biosynthesis
MKLSYSRSPLKVAFIHQPWSIIEPPVNNADSVALLTDELSRQLASQGCQVVCYCRQGSGQPQVDYRQGVEYRRASVSLDRWVKLGMQQLDRRRVRHPSRPFFSSALCYRQFIGQVISDLEHRPCDIVHIQNFSQFAPLIRAALPDVKIVLQMHCEWLNQLDPSMIDQRLRRCDLVLGVSDFLAAKMRARFPHLADRFRHVYNGAHLSRFAPSSRSAVLSPSERHPRILYVGRLSPEKGVHTLLEAFAKVVARHPEALLRLVGPEQVVPYEMIIPFCDDRHVRSLAPLFRPGAYGALLRDLILKLPPGSVEFCHNGAAQDELPPHYHAASVFVAPSIWDEPFGMPVVEAMASGTAVIGTCSGALPEIIDDGHSGLLVERDNPQSLADAILGLIEDPARRDALAQAGQIRAARMFTWERIGQNLLNEYARVLEATDTAVRGTPEAPPIDNASNAEARPPLRLRIPSGLPISARARVNMMWKPQHRRQVPGRAQNSSWRPA